MVMGDNGAGIGLENELCNLLQQVSISKLRHRYILSAAHH